ncbi:YraN family protein [Heliobacterium gestii]|uniref:UPF0102 protein GTO89_10665 n=1 Tax=Heliomicrobium gestii TaxID=2699 RepID=A0A845LD68_HELGE|nr:YraN family protein [Heliomicrobium gestii]MBM7867084.1 putative endonuclease [Heliomicrobium gestii]MZP43501.1 YraN family protein [Heliomicrobium gestii]
MDRIRLGRWGEDWALQHLLKLGWSLICRNYRTPRGEIDLILRESNWIVFVEVRTRSSERFGRGEETIDYRKRRRLMATAGHFLGAYEGPPANPRFDLISILRDDKGGYSLHHIRGMFTP